MAPERQICRPDMFMRSDRDAANHGFTAISERGSADLTVQIIIETENPVKKKQKKQENDWTRLKVEFVGR